MKTLTQFLIVGMMTVASTTMADQTVPGTPSVYCELAVNLAITSTAASFYEKQQDIIRRGGFETYASFSTKHVSKLNELAISNAISQFSKQMCALAKEAALEALVEANLQPIAEQSR